MKKLLLLLSCVSLGLTACGDTKLIGSKTAPDELSVIDAAPLSLPPDFQLRPPEKGKKLKAARNAKAAKNIIETGDKRKEAPAAGTNEPVDSWLIQKAGGDKRDPNIRQRLETHEKRVEEAEENEGWFQKTFGRKTKPVMDEDTVEDVKINGDAIDVEKVKE